MYVSMMERDALSEHSLAHHLDLQVGFPSIKVLLRQLSLKPADKAILEYELI